MRRWATYRNISLRYSFEEMLFPLMEDILLKGEMGSSPPSLVCNKLTLPEADVNLLLQVIHSTYSLKHIRVISVILYIFSQCNYQIEMILSNDIKVNSVILDWNNEISMSTKIGCIG